MAAHGLEPAEEKGSAQHCQRAPSEDTYCMFPFQQGASQSELHDFLDVDDFTVGKNEQLQAKADHLRGKLATYARHLDMIAQQSEQDQPYEEDDFFAVNDRVNRELLANFLSASSDPTPGKKNYASEGFCSDKCTRDDQAETIY